MCILYNIYYSHFKKAQKFDSDAHLFKLKNTVVNFREMTETVDGKVRQIKIASDYYVRSRELGSERQTL